MLKAGQKTFKLLDLYCGGGGATHGYHLSGFEVTGVDKNKMPHYPKHSSFIQGNAIDILQDKTFIAQFDIIHASPVCKLYSRLKGLASKTHSKDIEVIRALLIEAKKPYIIENVEGAPLINPLLLCGTMFNMPLRRHRLFETSFEILMKAGQCNCTRAKTLKPGISSFENGAKHINVTGKGYKVADGQYAMQIDWLPQRYLSEAIPPYFTQFVGNRALEFLTNQ